MGVVYLGVAPDSSLVAVKVLRPELADDPEFRRRFGREVAVLMRVKGLCTVRVIEADTDSQLPFMVTEYAEGPSLAEYIDTYGCLNADMLYGLATGLAEALTVIHAAGIVHRDLKPSNVILAADGPKVIDFGIAQALDATSLTKTGMMVGSPGFMAPEQVTGRPGPAADIFVWGVTIGYAAAGHSPFGTGNTNAILYRVLYADPDIAAIPDALKPLVAAALAKDPLDRPAAHELLDRLTRVPARSAPVTGRSYDAPTQTVLARTWQETGPQPSLPQPSGSLLLDPAPAPTRPAPRRPGRRARIGAAAAAAVAAAATLVLVLHPDHGPGSHLAGNEGNLASASALPGYPGEQPRGVFQTISRIVSAGNTMVTTGSQTSDSVVRQQFFSSSDGGASWHLAPVRWMAEGTQAIWTSRNGMSWTLAATHGITPVQPGDAVNAVVNTAGGFLAAGGGGQQAVIWLSHDAVTWQRMTATQLGLRTAAGTVPTAMSFATTRGNDTVISDQGSAWLSTNGGAAWTLVTIPVDHGARDSISGVSFDGSGLIAVRPGQTASGAPDGVAYFSPNGLTWQYAGTIDPAGGWTPGVVKGSDDGFVVTGPVSSQKVYVAYTSTGTGTTWRPTGALGGTSDESDPVPTVGPGGTVVAVGSANGTKISQQPVFLKADAAGHVTPVSLTAIAGGIIPEIAVKGTAVADGQQLAVGSADGYPAVWRKASGAWHLVSSLPLVSAVSGLTSLSHISHGTAGWIAAGAPGPVIYTSADGTTWHPAAGNITRDLANVAAVATAAGPAGYLIDGSLITPGGLSVADGWWSSNLTSWTRAQTGTPSAGSSQVLAVAAAAHGFVTVGSYDGKPAVWTTADGRLWTIDVLPVPAGASAGVLQQVASSGRRVVALGQQTTAAGTVPLAELSTDGGTSWQPVAFASAGPDTAVTALTASSGGFTAAGQFGATGQAGAAIWTSASGTNWTAAPISGLTGGGNHTVTTLAPSGSAVTGIDAILTQQGQQYVTVALPAR
ncbi:MAG: serine/threonine-protein kinase [Streptosporangiaceae bacterium]